MYNYDSCEAAFHAEMREIKMKEKSTENWYA